MRAGQGRSALFGFSFFLAAGSLFLACSGCSSPEPPPDLGPVGAFSLTERSGRTVTDADLRGKVWIASFVFTRCTGPCPQISGSMARLQSELAGEKDVVLVTFTVDPAHDDPEELKRYAGHFGADPQRWLFLTGKEETIYELSVKGFKVAVQRNAGPDVRPGDAVTHSTRLFLVDRRGHLRGYFDGRQVDDFGKPTGDLPKLKEALAAVLRETP